LDQKSKGGEWRLGIFNPVSHSSHITQRLCHFRGSTLLPSFQICSQAMGLWPFQASDISSLGVGRQPPPNSQDPVLNLLHCWEKFCSDLLTVYRSLLMSLRVPVSPPSEETYCGLDAKCPSEASVLKACSPGLPYLEMVEHLKPGSWWQALKSLRMCP
jgi:hypothetical protein